MNYRPKLKWSEKLLEGKTAICFSDLLSLIVWQELISDDSKFVLLSGKKLKKGSKATEVSIDTGHKALCPVSIPG